VSPVKYGLGVYIPEDDVLHSDRRENFKSYICTKQHKDWSDHGQYGIPVTSVQETGSKLQHLITEVLLCVLPSAVPISTRCCMQIRPRPTLTLGGGTSCTAAGSL
jgi:hypothetical protein